MRLPKDESALISNGRRVAVRVDTDKAQVDQLFDATLERFKTIDILVNNASLTNTMRHFLEADEQW